MAGARYRRHARGAPGSALILTVVLTSLLAMVGVLFLLVSRMQRTVVHASADARRLDLAVDQVLHRVEQQLIADIVDPVAGLDPYDAPDVNNAWLASLEPQEDANGLYWPQITDLTPGIDPTRSQRVLLEDRSDPNVAGPGDYELDAVIRERKPIYIDRTAVLPTGRLLDQLADADGDGIADARWFVLDASDADRPLFAAVRVVDQGGMLNVNTAFTLDRRDPNRMELLDGSHAGQIDLLALVDPNGGGDPQGMAALQQAGVALWFDRVGLATWPTPAQRLGWQRQVVWGYTPVFPLPYAPFDLSDELRLRYRFLLDHNTVNTRIENLWPSVYEGGPRTPMIHRKYTKGPQDYDLDRWQVRAGARVQPGRIVDYDLRHLSTTLNGDRLLSPPRGTPTTGWTRRQLDLNRQVTRITALRDQVQGDPNQLGDASEYHARLRELVAAVEAGLAPGLAGREALAAQFAVNLVDFLDADRSGEGSTVTVWTDPRSGERFFGFERQPFIRQLKIRLSASTPETPSSNAFLVELHNPFDEPVPLDRVALRLIPSHGTGPVVDADLVTSAQGSTWREIPGHGSLYVLNNQGADDLLTGEPNAADPNAVIYQPDLVVAEYGPVRGGDASLRTYNDLALVRRIDDSNAPGPIYLDHQPLTAAELAFRPLAGTVFAWQRGPIATWEIVEPVWRRAGSAGSLAAVSPGQDRDYNLEDPNVLLRPAPGAATGATRRLTRIGDILRLLTVGPGTDPNQTVGHQLLRAADEGAYRFDLRGVAGHRYAGLFQHLTVLDPRSFNPKLDAGDMRVKGRINVNTAPWFVLDTLPWMPADVAVALAANRTTGGAYASIGDLLRVQALSRLQRDQVTRRFDERDPNGGFDYPDFTADDTVDDLEEAHLLFAACSNLVTVRSDVFSVYLLVRIGADGPQRRVYALLDRSDVLQATDPVHTVLRQQVPDPR